MATHDEMRASVAAGRGIWVGAGRMLTTVDALDAYLLESRQGEAEKKDQEEEEEASSSDSSPDMEPESNESPEPVHKPRGRRAKGAGNGS